MSTYDRLVAAYGDPHQQQAFAKRNLITWVLPTWLAAVWPRFAGQVITRITINKALIDPLCAVMRELIATGLIKELQTYDGAFVYRNQRGSTALSIHAFGLALDFNAATNGLGKKVNFSQKFLDVWRRHGFTVGADFKGARIDGMHFEYTKTV